MSVWQKAKTFDCQMRNSLDFVNIPICMGSSLNLLRLENECQLRFSSNVSLEAAFPSAAVDVALRPVRLVRGRRRVPLRRGSFPWCPHRKPCRSSQTWEGHTSEHLWKHLLRQRCPASNRTARRAVARYGLLFY